MTGLANCRRRFGSRHSTNSKPGSHSLIAVCYATSKAWRLCPADVPKSSRYRRCGGAELSAQ